MDIIRLTVALDETDLRKLDKAIYTLSQKGVRVSRSYVVRALVRSMPDTSKLMEVIEELSKYAPDGRTKKPARRA